MTSTLTPHIDFHWPLPPFFQAASLPSADTIPECVVDGTDGRARPGRLVGLSTQTVRLQLPGQTNPETIALDRVRSIRLLPSMRLIAIQEVIEQMGAKHRDVAVEKTVQVSFRDGKRLSVKSRGFVKNGDGLFLFLIQADPAQTVPAYFPGAQIQDVQVGAPIGEALAERALVSSKMLAQALSRQAELREERLGKYLTDRAIVSVDDLMRALASQRQTPKLRIGEFLIKEKLITREQLQQALQVQQDNRQRRIGDILVEMGAVTVSELQVALADKLGIPFVDVREFVVEWQTVRLVTASFATANQVFPLLKSTGVLVVAVENPLAMDFTKELQFMVGLNIVPVIANPADLAARIAQDYGAEAPVVRGGAGSGSDHDLVAARPREKLNIDELATALAREVPKSAETPRAKEESAVIDSVLVRLVNKMIMEAHAQNASDIHIESNHNVNTRIRFRKDGELEDYLELQPSFRNALVSRVKIMAGLDISERRRGQDGKIEFARFGPLKIELRVAVVPTVNGLEDVVMRLLAGVEAMPIEAIGLLERDLARLRTMVSRSYGLVLVCGPTGSGKTTTLHSMMRYINRPDIKIWTAEDPVEISQPGLRQVQMNPKIGWTFADAMRAFLRADPDVIMVGEMRDAETAKISIEASLTGHLVLSTLHTNSAVESVIRLVDLGMDRFNFADALIGVLSQRLARKLCTRCRQAREATEEEIEDLALEYCGGTEVKPEAFVEQWREWSPSGQLVLHEAVGCSACRHGYRGRLALYELLEATPDIKHLIRSGGTTPQIAESARRSGMRLLRHDAIEKVLSGTIDLASARGAVS